MSTKLKEWVSRVLQKPLDDEQREFAREVEKGLKANKIMKEALLEITSYSHYPHCSTNRIIADDCDCYNGDALKALAQVEGLE